MTRRATKTKRRTANTPRRKKESDANVRTVEQSYADLEKKVERLTHEVSEALERQKATSEVLRVTAERSAGSAPDFPGDRHYRIYAAIEEEYDKGWVWIKDPPAPSRTLVKLQAKYEDKDKASKKWVTFCEARLIEKNFLTRYKARGRVAIKEPARAMVIGEWYRNALGGFPTDRQRELHEDDREIPNITVCEITKGHFWQFRGSWWRWWWAVRAACHHPDMAVRIGTRLGVLGAWLGLVATVDLMWKTFHPPLREIVRGSLPASILGLLSNWEREERVGPVALLAAVLLGLVAWQACRGPKRPTDHGLRS